MVDACHYLFVKPTECSGLTPNPAVNGGLWVLAANVGSESVTSAHCGGDADSEGQGVEGNLCLPLNFAMNLKLLKNKVFKYKTNLNEATEAL